MDEVNKNLLENNSKNKSMIVDEEKENLLENNSKDNNLNMDEEKENLLENNSKNKILKDKLKGILSAFIDTVVVAASATCVALLERKFPDFELNLIRALTGIVFYTSILIYKRQIPKVPKSDIKEVVVLCIITALLSTTLFIAVTLLPLSYFKSIYMSVEIISGILIYPICFKQTFDVKKMLFAFLCVCGVILSIQPEFIFTWKKHQDFLSNGTAQTNVENQGAYVITPTMTTIGYVLSVIVGLLGSLGVVAMKKSTTVKEHFSIVFFWVAMTLAILSSILMLIFEHPILPSSIREVVLIFLHSSCFAFGWIFYAISAKYISGETYNLILSTLVMTMLLPQYTLLKHILPGNHNWIEVLGSVLVFLGAAAGSIWELFKPSKTE